MAQILFSDKMFTLVYLKAQKSENMNDTETQVTTSIYLNPAYATARYDVRQKQRSVLQRYHTQRNFLTNTNTGTISKQTSRKIRLAVQWLVCMSDVKKVIDPVTGKAHNYRTGLLTLSLPTGCANVTPAFFRDVLMRSFFDAAQYRWGLKNYIWKIEKQARGALHVHITLDKYIPYQWINEKWCQILDKATLLEEYREKFSRMSCGDYILYRRGIDHQKMVNRFQSYKLYIDSLKKAFKKGRDENWSNPNCTDIHSVKKVKWLAAYMCKYLSKDPNLGADFKGRYWSCSHSLSKLRTVRLDIPEEDFIPFSHYLEQFTTGVEEIFYISKVDGDVHFLGCMYFFKKSIRAINSCSVIRQAFALLKSMYNQSRLDEMPFLTIVPDKRSNYKLQKLYVDAC